MSIQSAPHAVLGCGYVGRRLLMRLPTGVASLGVSRSKPDGFDHWLPINFDTDSLLPLVESLQGAVLFYFAAPSTTSLQDERSRRVVSALTEFNCKPAAIVLISTTGVYGDCAGNWVNEKQQPKAKATRSLRRIDAEQMWKQFAGSIGVSLAVLRVAGIYGPGRLPLARLKKDQPLLNEEQSPCSNRVHVDDLVDVALASVGLNEVINVADGTPSTMTAYFHALADVTGVERLPEASREVLSADWSAGLRSYMDESRKIDNSRMRELLGGSLRYPDLKLGLRASLARE